MMKLHSIRLLIGWRGDGSEPDIECVAENCRDLGIEAKPGDDGALLLKVSVRPDASPVGSERKDVQGAEEVSVHQTIYDAFTAFSQVNKYDFSSVFGHCNLPFQNSPLISSQQFSLPVGKGGAC